MLELNFNPNYLLRQSYCHRNKLDTYIHILYFYQWVIISVGGLLAYGHIIHEVVDDVGATFDLHTVRNTLVISITLVLNSLIRNMYITGFNAELSPANTSAAPRTVRVAVMLDHVASNMRTIVNGELHIVNTEDITNIIKQILTSLPL